MRPNWKRPDWLPPLAIVAVLALLATAGCTLIGDQVVGSGRAGSGPETCVKECNDTYKDLYQQEQQRHLEQVEACQTLPQPDKEACLDAEGARHEAAMDALGAAKLECQNGCHAQGSGAAG
jgi:hypothetical protein